MSNLKPQLFDLIERIGRLALPDGERRGLNPREVSVLRFLGSANVFSRSPDVAADYLGLAPRDVTAIFRALEARGLIRLTCTGRQKTIERADLTEDGIAVAAESPLNAISAENLTPAEVAVLTEGLSKTLRALLIRRGQRSFGICATCNHHVTRPEGPWCGLIGIALDPGEIEKMCKEHSLS